MRILLSILLLLSSYAVAQTPLSLTNGSAVTQDFNTLGNSGTSSTTPAGWGFLETGANLNTLYTAGTGSSNAGDTYSFGAAASTERAFGGLQSGSLVPTVGAAFTNNTGSTITALTISYTGEQWRLGTSARAIPDRIDFQYSTNATDLSTASGTWTDVDTLDFTGPFTVGTVGLLDGNAAANRTVLSAVTISGLNIPNGATFRLRWVSFDASGADDGLAVDDFSLTPVLSGGGSSLSGTGLATPASVLAGNTTLLTVAVTPATSPASTGITVTGNLSTIGGSASQTFFDNGTNGDVTSGDNIFSFSYTVPGATTGGAKVLPFAVADAQARNANGNINLTVTVPAVLSNINTIQGAGLNSPLANGTSVTTTGIVTGVRGDSFYLQNADADADADANTSEGLFVFAGSGNVPACAVVANKIQITGNVVEFLSTATAAYKPPVGSASLTELESPSNCTVLSTGNTLPTPVVLSAANLSASALTAADRWTQLEKFENMRVTTGALSTTENGGSSTIFATLSSVPGPFREAGIQATKYPTGATVPFFDSNPETFRIEGGGLNGGNAAFDLTYGSTISSVTGILTYAPADGIYIIRTNAAGVGTQTSSNLAATPVPVPLATDLTVVTMNAENFDGTNATKLAKVSATIRNILNNPDIIGFEEMGSDAALQALANQITADGGPAYSRGIFGTGTQRVAFLYRTSKLQNVNIVEATSVAANTYINPVNSASEPTFDRVPLILTATAKLPGSDSGVPVTVVVIHPKSLIDVDNANETNASDAGRRNQAKRHAGARDTGNLLQTLNTAGVHLFTVGDYNAFQFSDGYVDVTACIKGQAPGPQVFNPAAVASTAACLSYPPANQLINLTDANPAARYSLMFMGNRQSLDHIVVNANANARVRQVATAYVNSDYPRFGAISTNAARPERFSDHNPHIAYMTLPNEVTSQVQVLRSGLIFNRVLRLFTGTISVKNNSASAIGAPVHVFFHGLPVGVTLANATGTSNGVPYITINTTVAPGQTSTPAAVQFSVVGNVAINYTTKTFSQTF